MKHGFLVLAVGAWLSFAGCATPSQAHKQYVALSPESREVFDKYRQFLSENQQSAFLAATTDEDRQQQIQDLHIEERLEVVTPSSCRRRSGLEPP